MNRMNLAGISASLRLHAPERSTPSGAPGLVDLLGSDGAMRFEGRSELAKEGERSALVYLIVDGWAASYRQLDAQRRQITGLLLPGDLTDHDLEGRLPVLQSVAAIGTLTAVPLERDDLAEAAAAHPDLRAAIAGQAATHGALLLERTVSVGRRRALERVAHLFCEVAYRATGKRPGAMPVVAFPMHQGDIADITALTPVHVNRTLQQLRAQGLIELRQRRLAVLDLPALERLARFDRSCLG